MRALAAMIFATTSLIGCAVGEEEDGIDQIQDDEGTEVIGGAPDYGDPAVGMLRFVTKFDPATGRAVSFNQCTGTLVTPQIMVTAAHCRNPSALWSDVTFAQAPDMFAPHLAAGYTDGKIINSPLWTGNLAAGHDIAVFILAKPVARPVAARGPTPAVGSYVRAIGYGNTTFAQTGSGTKRHISIKVNNIEAHVFGAGYEAHNVCHGDSGGPTVQNGRIVGVNDYVDTPDCHGGGHFTRLDDNLPFLRTYVPGF